MEKINEVLDLESVFDRMAELEAKYEIFEDFGGEMRSFERLLEDMRQELVKKADLSDICGLLDKKTGSFYLSN